MRAPIITASLLFAAVFPVNASAAPARDDKTTALSQLTGDTNMDIAIPRVQKTDLLARHYRDGGQARQSSSGGLSNNTRYWAVVEAGTGPQRTKIAEAGLAIEEIGPSTVSGIAHENALALLEKSGFKIRSKTTLLDFSRSMGLLNFPSEDSAYHNYDETLAALKTLEAENAKMASVFSIGKTWEGRDIWALRLNTTEKGNQPSGKPGAVFIGKCHAREHLSTEVPLLLAEWLAANKTSPQTKKLLETLDIYIIPMMNPDGGEYDITGDEYQWHRKNMRVNPDKSLGVDLNRNFGYKWGGAGSSGSTWSDTYRGPSAFSEPESQAVKNFIESKLNLKTLISYHSYSELVLYPWGGSDEQVPDANDRKAFIAMAEKMADITGYTAEKSSDLYVATGDLTDWTYDAKGIFSFTIELTPRSSSGGGFYPGPSAIKYTADVNIKAALYLLDMTDNPHKSIQPSPAQTASRPERSTGL